MSAYTNLVERKRNEVISMLKKNNSTYFLTAPYPQVKFVIPSKDKEDTNSIVTLDVKELTLINNKLMVSGTTEHGEICSLPIENVLSSYNEGELIIYEHIGFTDDTLSMVFRNFKFITTALENNFLRMFEMFGNVISDTDNELEPCFIKKGFDDEFGKLWYEFTEIKFKEGEMFAYDNASETYINFNELTFEDKITICRHFYILTEGGENKNLYISM
jgi:hypothetical protein